MVYYDIHTHYPPVHPEDVSIINTIVGADRPDNPVSYSGGKQAVLLQEYRSIGIHPWYIYNVKEQLAELTRQAVLPNVVAIGETGLDKQVEVPLDCQQEVFKASASLAESLSLFLIIHCVKAWDELIALKKELNPRMPWVIHGFRGNATLAKQLIRQGFFLSFGARFNPEAVRAAWPDRLFVETDDREIDIRTVYQNLSAIQNLPLEQFTAQVAGNVCRILRLS